ncbi:MAG: DUF72 domain-containing protein [Eubacteriales bacterium]
MILIGTAGYSYPDWVGPVYPEGIKKGEMLEYYAREFMFTEINSSYYGMPNKYMMWNMVQKTPAGFQFVVKTHQSMTHQRTAGKEAYGQFREALQPVVEADKLGGVLAQFPFSFHCTKAHMEYLKWFAGQFAGMPVAVEFRNQKWVCDETFDLLAQNGLAYVCVDEPDVKGLVKPVTAVTAEVGYVRFHGRNAAKWYDHKESYERYNYLYSEDELAEWTPRIREMEAKSQKIFVSLNNHYQGQAVRNARMVREMLK